MTKKYFELFNKAEITEFLILIDFKVKISIKDIKNWDIYFDFLRKIKGSINGQLSEMSWFYCQSDSY